MIPPNIYSNAQINQSQIGSSSTDYSHIFIVSGSMLDDSLCRSVSLLPRVVQIGLVTRTD